MEENLSRRDKEKLMHEKDILAAAEQVFCRKGYEDACMDEIAREAQFTKRTVYQHFENKDDLYFAVVLKGLNKLFSEIAAEIKRVVSGYQKLEKFCLCYDKFYRENPKIMSLINHSECIPKKSAEEGRYKKELIQYNLRIFHKLEEIIEEGKADGSIQPGIDSGKTALSLMLLIKGYYNQLSAAVDLLESYLSTDQKDFSLTAIDLLIKPLQRSRSVTATRKGTA